jgi:tRNA(Ile)-lysidine synthase
MGVAVSGGGDSIALLHILAAFCAEHDITLFAATVDHGLRPESAQEAETVARFAQSLSVDHTILHWDGWDGTGNLQDYARRARYDLLTSWAKSLDISILTVGHTANDQAETVVMRLSRLGGVDGLAAMPVRRVVNGVTLVRPMLEITRAELRDYLVQNGIDWVEDPSNSDLRYDRIKARQALEILAPLGITVPVLTEVAAQLGQARGALDWYSFLAARDICHINEGNIVIELKNFRTLPDEIARRVLVRAVMWISGSRYAPRRKAMADLIASVRSGTASTLDGCIVTRKDGALWVCREYKAVQSLRAGIDEDWDQRWQAQNLSQGDSTRAGEGFEVRALGPQGLDLCPDWKKTNRPRHCVLSSPALWSGNDLISAPHAGRPEGWRFLLLRGEEDFYSALLSH